MLEEGSVLPPEMREVEKRLLYVNNSLRVSAVVKLFNSDRRKKETPALKVRHWGKRGSYSLDVSTRDFLVFKYIAKEFKYNQDIYFAPLDIPYLADILDRACEWFQLNSVAFQRHHDRISVNKKSYLKSMQSAMGKSFVLKPAVNETDDGDVAVVRFWFGEGDYAELKSGEMWSLAQYVRRIDIAAISVGLLALATSCHGPQRAGPEIDPDMNLRITETDVLTMSLEELIEFCNGSESSVDFEIDDVENFGEEDKDYLRKQIIERLRKERTDA